MRTIWGMPSSPLATSSRARAKLGSKRRLKPTWKVTPLALTASRTRSMRARSRSIGFSQKTCLPACAAASMSVAWVSVLVQMITASTAGSSMMRRGSSQAYGTPSSAASSCAAGRRMSAIAARFAPGSLVARCRPWSRPMRPAPRRPIRMGSLMHYLPSAGIGHGPGQPQLGLTRILPSARAPERAMASTALSSG